MAAPDVREGRHMLSLTSGDRVIIQSKLKPGETKYGACACCNAPSWCWCLVCMPCCMYPKDITDKMEGSKYIYVRENSIEWNEPEITFAECSCFIPCNPCALDVIDHVEVLYFDSPNFDKIRNKTRTCNDARSWCCGGNGQRVQIVNSFCGDLCYVGRNGVPCCPSCCPDCISRPFTNQYNIYCDDADTTVYEMKRAKQNALQRMGLA